MSRFELTFPPLMPYIPCPQPDVAKGQALFVCLTRPQADMIMEMLPTSVPPPLAPKVARSQTLNTEQIEFARRE